MKQSTLEIKHDFPVSKEDLYSAWTSPEKLKQWWKPLNSSLISVQNDIKENGILKYEFSSGKDNPIIITGEYIEVTPQEKLVYTWNWDIQEHGGKFKLTISFVGDQVNSSICILQENFQNEEAIVPHKEGWEKGLSDLFNYLTNASSAGRENEEEITGGTSSNGENEFGYGGTIEQEKVGGVDL